VAGGELVEAIERRGEFGGCVGAVGCHQRPQDVVVDPGIELMVIGCPAHEEDDVAQDAFLAVRARWDQMRALEQPRAYSFKVAARRWWRVERGARAVEDDAAGATPERPGDGSFGRDERDLRWCCGQGVHPLNQGSRRGGDPFRRGDEQFAICGAVPLFGRVSGEH
jgi:hypothetical protein